MQVVFKFYILDIVPVLAFTLPDSHSTSQLYWKSYICEYMQLKMEMNDKFKEQGNILQRICTELEELKSK